MGESAQLSDSEIALLFGELQRARRAPEGDELGLVETAFFLEELFGIRVSEGEIAPETLGTFEIASEFVRAKLGRA